MPRDIKKPQTSIVGSAGEHLVLSRLLMKNYIAALAPEYTKSYDIIVLNKDGTTSFPIQVKSSFDVGSGWMLGKKHEEVIENLFFAFVAFKSSTDDPEIYIIDSKLVSKLVKTSHKMYLKVPGRKGQKHNDSTMRRLLVDYSSTYKNFPDHEKYLNKEEILFLKEYSKGWLEPYKDAWHLLKS